MLLVRAGNHRAWMTTLRSRSHLTGPAVFLPKFHPCRSGGACGEVIEQFN
jgi:hypothetical protein